MQLTIDYSEWNEDIESLDHELSKELINILQVQELAVAKINRYLAMPSETSFYKNVPELITDEIARINSFFEEKLLSLASYNDKKTLQNIQGELLRKCRELLKELDSQTIKPQTDKEKPSDLYGQLQGVDSLLSLQTLLGIIASKNIHYDPKCSLFISYAWPTDENKKEEYWVQPFLRGLRDHLRLAGIPASLDVDDNFLGNSIDKFAERIKESHYICLIGTPSLKKKHTNGTHLVCVELNHIKEKRDEDIEKGLFRVLPLLLRGEMNEAFPPEYQRYTTVRRPRSYLLLLKQLIAQLYGVGVKNEEYNQLWSTFAEGIQDEHPDWVKDILYRPYQLPEQPVHRSAVPDSPSSGQSDDAMSFPVERQTSRWQADSNAIKQIAIKIESLRKKIHDSLGELARRHTLARLYLYADPGYDEICQEHNKVATFEDFETENQALLRQLQHFSNDPFVVQLKEQSQLIQIGLRGSSGLLLYKQRHYLQASEELNSFINQLNEIPPELLTLKAKVSLITNAYNLLAKIFRSTGNYAEAIEAYKKALVFSPEDPIILSSLGALFNDLAKYNQNYSMHIEAMTYHRMAEKLIYRSVESNQCRSFVLTNLGRGLQQLVEAKQIPQEHISGTLKKAEKVLGQAISLNPDNLTAYLFRGIIYMEPSFAKQPLLVQAITDFNYLLERQPEHPTALIRKARVLVQQNQFSVAKELLDDASHYLECKEWIPKPEKDLWKNKIQLLRENLPHKEENSMSSPIFGFWSKGLNEVRSEVTIQTNEDDGEKEKLKQCY